MPYTAKLKQKLLNYSNGSAEVRYNLLEEARATVNQLANTYSGGNEKIHRYNTLVEAQVLIRFANTVYGNDKNPPFGGVDYYSVIDELLKLNDKILPNNKDGTFTFKKSAPAELQLPILEIATKVETINPDKVTMLDLLLSDDSSPHLLTALAGMEKSHAEFGDLGWDKEKYKQALGNTIADLQQVQNQLEVYGKFYPQDLHRTMKRLFADNWFSRFIRYMFPESTKQATKAAYEEIQLALADGVSQATEFKKQQFNLIKSSNEDCRQLDVWMTKDENPNEKEFAVKVNDYLEGKVSLAEFKVSEDTDERFKLIINQLEDIDEQLKESTPYKLLLQVKTDLLDQVEKYTSNEKNKSLEKDRVAIMETLKLTLREISELTTEESWNKLNSSLNSLYSENNADESSGLKTKEQISNAHHEHIRNQLSAFQSPARSLGRGLKSLLSDNNRLSAEPYKPLDDEKAVAKALTEYNENKKTWPEVLNTMIQHPNWQIPSSGASSSLSKIVDSIQQHEQTADSSRAYLGIASILFDLEKSSNQTIGQNDAIIKNIKLDNLEVDSGRFETINPMNSDQDPRIPLLSDEVVTTVNPLNTEIDTAKHTILTANSTITTLADALFNAQMKQTPTEAWRDIKTNLNSLVKLGRISKEVASTTLSSLSPMIGISRIQEMLNLLEKSKKALESIDYSLDTLDRDNHLNLNYYLTHKTSDASSLTELCDLLKRKDLKPADIAKIEARIVDIAQTFRDALFEHVIINQQQDNSSLTQWIDPLSDIVLADHVRKQNELKSSGYLDFKDKELERIYAEDKGVLKGEMKQWLEGLLDSKNNIHLCLVDMQIDFLYNGCALPVPGAENAVIRNMALFDAIAALEPEQLARIKLVQTKDDHIYNRKFDDQGNVKLTEAQYTSEESNGQRGIERINLNEAKELFRPNFAKDQFGLHCIKNTIGNEIVGPLKERIEGLEKRGLQVTKVEKTNFDAWASGTTQDKQSVLGHFTANIKSQDAIAILGVCFNKCAGQLTTGIAGNLNAALASAGNDVSDIDLISLKTAQYTLSIFSGGDLTCTLDIVRTEAEFKAVSESENAIPIQLKEISGYGLNQNPKMVTTFEQFDAMYKGKGGVRASDFRVLSSGERESNDISMRYQS